MIEEQVDIFDCDYNHLGVVTKKLAHRLGLWHQSFHCWIFNPETNKLLIQLRSKDKSTHPNLLDISAAGHISAGENIIDGMRELEEELNLFVDDNKLIYAGCWKQATNLGKVGDPNYKNREFCHTYFLFEKDKKLSDYKIQEEELDGLFEVELNDLKDLFLKNKQTIIIEGFTKDNGYGYKWEVSLSNFVDRGNIWLKAINIIEDIKNSRKNVFI